MKNIVSKGGKKSFNVQIEEQKQSEYEESDYQNDL